MRRHVRDSKEIYSLGSRMGLNDFLHQELYLWCRDNSHPPGPEVEDREMAFRYGD